MAFFPAARLLRSAFDVSSEASGLVFEIQSLHRSFFLTLVCLVRKKLCIIHTMTIENDSVVECGVLHGFLATDDFGVETFHFFRQIDLTIERETTFKQTG